MQKIDYNNLEILEKYKETGCPLTKCISKQCCQGNEIFYNGEMTETLLLFSSWEKE